MQSPCLQRTHNSITEVRYIHRCEISKNNTKGFQSSTHSPQLTMNGLTYHKDFSTLWWCESDMNSVATILLILNLDLFLGQLSVRYSLVVLGSGSDHESRQLTHRQPFCTQTTILFFTFCTAFNTLTRYSTLHHKISLCEMILPTCRLREVFGASLWEVRLSCDVGYIRYVKCISNLRYFQLTMRLQGCSPIPYKSVQICI